MDSSSVPSDYDEDGICDVSDIDDDNDGVPDNQDAFQFNSGESADSDSDGIGDNADLDDDNDGWFDSVEYQCGTDG